MKIFWFKKIGDWKLTGVWIKRITTAKHQLATKDAEFADLKRQLETRTEELRISRQAEKYNADVADQADAARREATRQLAEARKDTERLKELCKRSYTYLGFWFSSLKPEEQKLWKSLHKELHMRPKREAFDAAREG